jgi:4-hydroxythreonine-4-phosphate dehydrogenase
MPGSTISRKMPIFPSGEERIVITLGDAAGIGPEVTLKAIHGLKRSEQTRVLLLGRASFYSQLNKKLGLGLSFSDLPDVSEPSEHFGAIRCYFPGSFPNKIKLGLSDDTWTRIAVDSIKLGASLAMAGEADAIVTPPINKAGLKKAGFNIPGHTEYLAELSNSVRFEMMLVGGPLKVVLVTRHLPIKTVSKKITTAGVLGTILLVDRELRRSFGIRKPRLVVCGLNPHAGEQGTIGLEEIQIIAPAVQAARKKTDAIIVGPLSPDSLFHDAYEGRYDAEICMYHDQGLIPLKMISRGAGVNVTLGLPFVRTSPDHGTGYDIAKKYIADPGSMVEAIRLALQISRNRKRYDKAC